MEVNHALAEREVPNAAVDLDALTWLWPPDSAFNSDLMFECLNALWPTYLRRGVAHLVLARVVEAADELDRYRSAIPGAAITVCRLVASEQTRVRRLMARIPPGPSRDWHLKRTVELESILAQRSIEHFTVDNDERPPGDVALDILERVGWL